MDRMNENRWPIKCDIGFQSSLEDKRDGDDLGECGHKR